MALTDDAIGKIKTMIVSGELGPGDRLPREADLAVRLGLSFALIRNADGTESLRAATNSQYVTAESGGAQPLIANRAAIGPWEKFDLVP